jgi:hypothetical protein
MDSVRKKNQPSTDYLYEQPHTDLSVEYENHWRGTNCTIRFEGCPSVGDRMKELMKRFGVIYFTIQKKQ